MATLLVSPPKQRFGVRHLQAVLMAFSLFIAYALRSNLSVAIVAMAPADHQGSAQGNATRAGGGAQVFDWDEATRGALLSAFFWGYMLSMIPGGILAQRFGGTRLLAGALVSTSAVTLLLPVCANLFGWKAVFANRVIQGLTQAPVFPSVYNLLGVWAPPQERESFTTFILAFQMLGPMFGSPLCGFMASLWGWPSIFFSFGMAGVVMGATLWLLGVDRPAQHRWITPEELAYIESAMRTEDTRAKRAPRTPWRQVCTSAPIWMVWTTLAVQDMAYFTFLTDIPTYLNGALNFNLEENGMLTSLPYLTSFIACFLFTALANFIRDRKLMSTTNNRKFLNGIASCGISVCIVSTGYASSKAASVAFICLSMGFLGATYVGVQANYLDLAPLHAGPIYAVGNMGAAVLGVVGPQLVGFVVTDIRDTSQWKAVFWSEAAILMTACVFYTWLASGEVQPWNDPPRTEHKGLPTLEDGERQHCLKLKQQQEDYTLNISKQQDLALEIANKT